MVMNARSSTDSNSSSTLHLIPLPSTNLSAALHHQPRICLRRLVLLALAVVFATLYLLVTLLASDGGTLLPTTMFPTIVFWQPNTATMFVVPKMDEQQQAATVLETVQKQQRVFADNNVTQTAAASATEFITKNNNPSSSSSSQTAQQQQQQQQQTSSPPLAMTAPPTKKVPIILGWNNYHEFGNIVYILLHGYKHLLTANNLTGCPYQCMYTQDRKFESDAAIIIFHIRVGYGRLPAQRLPHQLYTFYLDESPYHTGGAEYRKLAPDFFNLTMTYRKDSDIWYPYGRLEHLDGDQAQQSKINSSAATALTDAAISDRREQWTEEEIEAKIAGKKRVALLIISNCWTPSKREHYITELRKHMNGSVNNTLTLRGACYGAPIKDETDYWQEIDSHFFYLALENSVCHQYVSEKFWNSLRRLTVPVVLNRRVFDGLDVPPDAFIAADDFPSAKALADHLVWLSRVENRAAYKRHLQWTRHYKRTNYHRIGGPNNPLCQLCRMAHQAPTTMMQTPRIVRNVWKFWEWEGICTADWAKNAPKASSGKAKRGNGDGNGNGFWWSFLFGNDG